MIEIDDAAIDADLRRSFDAINLERAEAGTEIWQALLDHAGRPLNWSGRFDPGQRERPGCVTRPRQGRSPCRPGAWRQLEVTVHGVRAVRAAASRSTTLIVAR
jgi:hypothetical protein